MSGSRSRTRTPHPAEATRVRGGGGGQPECTSTATNQLSRPPLFISCVFLYASNPPSPPPVLSSCVTSPSVCDHESSGRAKKPRNPRDGLAQSQRPSDLQRDTLFASSSDRGEWAEPSDQEHVAHAASRRSGLISGGGRRNFKMSFWFQEELEPNTWWNHLSAHGWEFSASQNKRWKTAFGAAAS